MAKRPISPDTSPDDFPTTTPRDLHPTSDIRFVMLKIGELTTKVDSLMKSVDSHGTKIDDLRDKVTFVKGAVWVLTGLFAILGVAAIWYFSGKLSITINPN
jgi:hypothetical protein